MRPSTLPKTAITSILCVLLAGLGCGRKGDPIPRPRAAARACQASWVTFKRLRVVLPEAAADASSLRGVEKVWVYYLPLGVARPAPAEVVAKGEVVLERRRPDLPGPGEALELDLSRVVRDPGWVVVSAVRVGDVVGQPSPVLPWMHAAIRGE